MEAQIAKSLQFSATSIDFHTVGKKTSRSVQFLLKSKEKQRQNVLISTHLHPKGISRQHRRVGLEVTCSYQHHSDPILKSGTFYSPFDEDLILKNKSQEILPYLNGRSIYLVGMMGCGKTTVGKILSKALGYSFCDSDAVVEHDVGMPVADIFKLRGQDFFRVKESEALQKLSLMSKVVASTGGGAVVLPVNWRYMQRGVTVWLDVPLEALARRIAAVGTDSRPLLHHESGDAYTRALRRLSTLMEERGEAYTNADAKVSVENIAAKTGQTDVCDLSPASIAIEALEQIRAFLKGENGTASIAR